MWDDRAVAKVDVQAVEGKALAVDARVEVDVLEGEGRDEKYT